MALAALDEGAVADLLAEEPKGLTRVGGAVVVEALESGALDALRDLVQLVHAGQLRW